MRACLVFLLFAVSSLHAWNREGHRTVAWIAYKHLSPAAKAQVDSILQNHPDYAVWTKDLPADTDRNAEAFLRAASWPDELRNDPRLWDDLAKELKPTPLMSGFPDMKMHKNWHYTNVPLVTSGKLPGPSPDPTNIEERLHALRTEPLSAYNLAWLIHMVGDVHQPLHCVARFSGSHLAKGTGVDRGDAGGNFFLIDDPVKNLHSLWDNALPATNSRTEFENTAASLTTSVGSVVHLNTSSWVEESVELAKTVVYTIGDDAPNSTPPKVTPEYRATLQRAARERIALAGYRLAAILNARLH